jgi:hypothetical protein
MQGLKIYIAIAVIMFTGCAGSASWKRVNPDRPTNSGKYGVSAGLPGGWLMFEDKKSRAILLTRHSVPLGFIQIVRHPLFKPLPHTAHTINAGMQAYEAAEVLVSNLRAAPGVFDLEVVELSPARICGADAFELLAVYAMDNGMRRRCVTYGFMVGDKYFMELSLYALEDYYFDAALGEFLELVESVKIR